MPWARTQRTSQARLRTASISCCGAMCRRYLSVVARLEWPSSQLCVGTPPHYARWHTALHDPAESPARRTRVPRGAALARRAPVVLRHALLPRRGGRPRRALGDDRRGPEPALGSRLAAGRAHARSLDDRPPAAAPRGLEARPHAELGAFATFHTNDMVVDAQGRAYVGNFGFDLDAQETPKPAALLRVDPDGTASLAADELMFPNGTVITPDGRTLIVGESFGARLTAFDLADDGSLSNRRVWAAVERAVSDGICLDAEGAIWVASPTSAEVLRVREGGEVTHRVPLRPRRSPACSAAPTTARSSSAPPPARAPRSAAPARPGASRRSKSRSRARGSPEPGD